MHTAKQEPEDATEASVQVSVDMLRNLGGGDRRTGIKRLRAWLHLQPGVRKVSGPTAKPSNVRVAVPADEPALLKLMLQDVEENALKIATPDPAKIMEHIQAGTRLRGGILGVIDGPNGVPVACINLTTTFQWWWSRQFYLMEIWKYVHPDHRKSTYADDLARFARWCSDDMSAGFGYRVWLLQGVTSTTDVDRKALHYARHGNPIGAFFIYPHPGDAA